MSAVQVLAELARAGVELACRDGRLCARPSLRARPSLLALVREHAAELRRVLDSGAPQQAHELDDAQREAFEERAAIMEYDGGLTRAEAEQAARPMAGAGGVAGEPRGCEPGAGTPGLSRCAATGKKLQTHDEKPAAWSGEVRGQRA